MYKHSIHNKRPFASQTKCESYNRLGRHHVQLPYITIHSYTPYKHGAQAGVDHDESFQQNHSYIHCVQKKTPTYIFNYNSGISWSIFIICVPGEREINTLQFTYLQS